MSRTAKHHDFLVDQHGTLVIRLESAKKLSAIYGVHKRDWLAQGDTKYAIQDAFEEGRYAGLAEGLEGVVTSIEHEITKSEEAQDDTR